MKTIKKLAFLLVLVTLALSMACKKDHTEYTKNFTSFKVVLNDATGKPQEYPGTISANEIVVQLPIDADVTVLKPQFTVDNARTIVQVGNTVQESGLSAQDFTNGVSYKIKAEDKSTQTYNVRVEKKTAMHSFGFFKEDNPTLATNYVGVIKGLKVNIALPESVDLTKLVARFVTNTGATLRVSGTVQESKKTINNFSSPVTYSFSDAGLPTPVEYAINISFLGPQWFKIGDENIIVPTASGIKLAFNPFTNLPYFVYQRSGKGEDGKDIDSDFRNLAVIRYTGTSWENVGPVSGITDFKSDNANIAFDANGDIFVGYLDYKAGENKASVLKYSNGNWASFGNLRFTPMKTTKMSFALGEGDMPLVGLVSNSTDVPGYPRNVMYVTGYKNNAWADITPVASKMISYIYTFKGLDGKSYAAILDRSPARGNLYKMVNNAWQPVGPTSFSPSDGLPGYTTITGAVAADGTAYVAFQTIITSQRVNRVFKFNGTTWTELTDAGSSQDQTDKYNLAIHPDGTLFFTYANTSGLYSRTFNTTSNTWNTPRLIISGKVNNFDMQIAPDGTPYLAAGLTSSNKTVVYKYALNK